MATKHQIIGIFSGTCPCRDSNFDVTGTPKSGIPMALDQPDEHEIIDCGISVHQSCKLCNLILSRLRIASACYSLHWASSKLCSEICSASTYCHHGAFIGRMIQSWNYFFFFQSRSLPMVFPHGFHGMREIKSSRNKRNRLAHNHLISSYSSFNTETIVCCRDLSSSPDV